MRSRILWILLLLPCSCGKTDPVKPPPIPATPDIALPEVEDVPRTELPDDLPGPAVSWDFSRGLRHGFRMREEGTLVLSAGAAGPGQASPARTIRTKSEGYLEIQGLGEGVGELRYKLAERERQIDGRPADINGIDPLLFSGPFRGDGTAGPFQILKGKPDTGMVTLFLRFPPGPFTIGETREQKVEWPPENGHPLRVGVLRTKVTGMSKVEQYDCVRIETEIDLTFAPAAPSEGGGRTRGRFIAYAAPRERRLVALAAAWTTAVRSRVPIVREGRPGAWSLGALDSSTRLSLRPAP